MSWLVQAGSGRLVYFKEMLPISSRWLCYFCLCAINTTWALTKSPAHAEITKSVVVTGMSAVYDGDTAAAFESAKKSALRRAVEEAIGVLISARTRVANFAVIDDDILSATRGYVRSFEVVEQGLIEEGLYEVTIEAAVDLGNLQSDLNGLELLLEESGRPRLVCVGGEYVLSDAGSSRVRWGTLCGELVRKLALLDTDLFEVDGLPSGLLAEVNPLAGASPAQGGDLAEILIVATASLQANQGLSIPFSDNGLTNFGIQSVVAEISARAQWADTGETLASARATGRGADTSFRTAATSAIEDAAPQVAAELGSAMVEDLRSKLYDGRLIKLQVLSDNARQLQIFETDLSERFGAVERLYPRPRTQAEANYEARSKGTAFDFARELTVKGVGELRVDIVSVTLNSMRLRLSE